MQYLDLCFKESTRLFPPSPIIALRTQNDVKLEDGRIIPQDVDVVIFCNLMQRDPKYFQEPDKFLPQRHHDDVHDTTSFNCIGGILGECQAKVVLAHLIKEYEWFVDSDDDTTTKAYSREGIMLKIRKRKS